MSSGQRESDANDAGTRRPTAKQVFIAALEIPRPERMAYLDSICAGDAALKSKVEELLRIHDDDVTFLSSPTAKSRVGRGTAEPPDNVGSAAPGPVDSNATAPDSTEIGEGLERPGAIIGRYKLLQKIGEGGFGVVFVAEQREPVYRRVALKIIKLGMDTRQVIARFEAERQALALMDHPSIARVLDAGATESGRPFFVMEYVKGAPITQFCDQNNLTIRERLALFSQVCLAVQHAHQKGVIHRDIKPGNVLVFEQDGRPQAKVIDFGIAKATDRQLTDKTLFTAHEAFIGTPQYMSPEQAAGSIDIDTRTDVYSLGVLLYELLTGVTPFDAKWLRSRALDEVKRIIREVEPQKPSTRVTSARPGGAGVSPARAKPGNAGVSPVNERENVKTCKGENVAVEPGGTEPGGADQPGGAGVSPATGNPKSSLDTIARLRKTDPARLPGLLRGDLDWIVMKALDKDRARRYAAASDLAADLQRHTAGEPVVAAPPNLGYRVRKFVRKHRGAVVTGGAVAAALLLGIGGTTWQWREARRAIIEARHAASEIESQAALARSTLVRIASIAGWKGDDWASNGTQIAESINSSDLGSISRQRGDILALAGAAELAAKSLAAANKSISEQRDIAKQALARTICNFATNGISGGSFSILADDEIVDAATGATQPANMPHHTELFVNSDSEITYLHRRIKDGKETFEEQHPPEDQIVSILAKRTEELAIEVSERQNDLEAANRLLTAQNEAARNAAESVIVHVIRSPGSEMEDEMLGSIRKRLGIRLSFTDGGPQHPEVASAALLDQEGNAITADLAVSILAEYAKGYFDRAKSELENTKQQLKRAQLAEAAALLPRQRTSEFEDYEELVRAFRIRVEMLPLSHPDVMRAACWVARFHMVECPDDWFVRAVFEILKAQKGVTWNQLALRVWLTWQLAGSDQFEAALDQVRQLEQLVQLDPIEGDLEFWDEWNRLVVYPLELFSSFRADPTNVANYIATEVCTLGLPDLVMGAACRDANVARVTLRTENLERGEYERAEQDARHAVSLCPDHIGFLSNLALVSLRLGDRSKALDVLRQLQSRVSQPSSEGLEVMEPLSISLLEEAGRIIEAKPSESK